MKLTRLVVSAVIVLLALACAAEAGAACKCKDPKIRVLFEVGGPFHDKPVLYNGLKKTLEDTGNFTVNVTKDRDQFKPANIKKYDLVIDYTTSGNLSKEQEQGLTNFVADGGGFVGIHSALDSYRNSDAYWQMVGGRFITHSRTRFKVNITAWSQVIVRPMKDFWIEDETYVDKFNPKSKIIVLMRRDMDDEPVAWVQYYGNGRVFMTNLGHGASAWNNPSFQELIMRAVLWATKRLNP